MPGCGFRVEGAVDWDKALPSVIAIILGLLGGGGLWGWLTSRGDRQSEDIWHFVGELQEELATMRGELRDLHIQRKADQETIAAHERTIIKQEAEIARLTARLAALEGGC